MFCGAGGGGASAGGFQNVLKHLLLFKCCVSFATRPLQKENCNTTIAKRQLQNDNCKTTIVKRQLQYDNCKTTIAKRQLQNDIKFSGGTRGTPPGRRKKNAFSH